MTNPQDDPETLARVCAGVEDLAYAAEEVNRLATVHDYLAFVRRHCPRPGRLLDAGCATGVFAGAAQQAGWEVTGADASVWAVERARARCASARFIAGPLADASFAPGSFEAATLWDVLEHLSDPAATVRRLHEWLVPGGWLFLNLPNADSWIARCMGRRWVLLLREHLWYFSPSTLRALLAPLGFAVIETRPNRVRFTVATIGGRLTQYPGFAGVVGRGLVSVPAVGRLSLRFPIGEMNVAARRR